jgi:hypothetical protein
LRYEAILNYILRILKLLLGYLTLGFLVKCIVNSFELLLLRIVRVILMVINLTIRMGMMRIVLGRLRRRFKEEIVFIDLIGLCRDCLRIC